MNSRRTNDNLTNRKWVAAMFAKINGLAVASSTRIALFGCLLLLVSASSARAVTITSNAVTGNWNAGTTWVGGVVPAAGDDVIIVPGANITVTTNTHINSITFNNTSATSRTLTVNFGVTLDVTGAGGILLENSGAAINTNATIGGSGTLNCLSITVGGTVTNLSASANTTITSTISLLSVSGNLTLEGEDDGSRDNNATFSVESGSLRISGAVTHNSETNDAITLLTLANGAQTATLDLLGATPVTPVNNSGETVNFNGASSTVIYSGSSAQTIFSTSYRNLRLSGGSTKTPAALFTTNGTFTVDSDSTLSVGAFSLTLSAGGFLVVNGTVDFNDANGEFLSGTTGTSTVTMGPSGLIRTIEGNGLGPTTPATDTSFQTQPGGAWSMTSIDTSGTVEYYRTGTGPVTDRNYNNLTITNASNKTWTLGATRTVNGSLAINTSAPLVLAGGNTINIKGDFTNNGTFNGGTTTIAFNGVTNQTIGGSSATTFPTLTVANTGSGDDVVSLSSAALTTVSTALNISDGIFDMGSSSSLTTNAVTVASAGTFRNLGTGDLTLSGNVSNSGVIKFSASGSPCDDAPAIQIRSTSTARTWSGTGTFSFSDVDVQNQTAGVPPTTIVVENGLNSGSNVGWTFVGCTTSATYTWIGGPLGSWIVPTNWTPTRTVPSVNDVLIIDGTTTPSPIINNVPAEEIAALRLINGASPTLNAGAANNTLTVSGRTGTDLSVPSSPLSVLTLAGANALRINVAVGSTASIDGQIIFQDAAHRLLGNAASAILFHGTADFTTFTGFTGNAFGSGGGAGNGFNGSVQFESGSQYFHNAGDSPFGAPGSGPVAVFQTGSEADWLTSSGFQASGRTYANLVIGNASTVVDVSDSGTGDFQFNNLVINSSGSDDSSLQFNGSGTSAVTIKGNITSAGTGLPGGTLADVLLTAGTGGIQINAGGTATFGNVGNSRSLLFGSNATVVSGTTLNLGRLVQMGISADGVVTDNGSIVPNFASVPGYIVGAVRKTSVPSSYVFPVGKITGYTPVTLSSATGGGDLTVRAVPGDEPSVNGATSLNEYWILTLNNGSLTTTLEFTYLDADVDGTEASYKVIRVENNSPLHFGLTSLNTSLNTASVTDINHFSNWTLGEPAGASAVKFAKFGAVSFSDGVQLTWETGFEVDNLGYHVYRENNGVRSRVTPSIIAGSALTVGPGNRMGAGYSYSWFDPEGTSDATYQIEAIDLNGGREWAGPISPAADSKGRKSPRRSKTQLLNEVAQSQVVSESNNVAIQTADDVRDAAAIQPTAENLTVQQTLARGKAVKIQVDKSGWYRLAQPELVAAGLDASADARLLQLFADGVEVPIGLSTGSSRLGANDTLEFYGVPLDTNFTGTRTYWLVIGSTTGKRFVTARGKGKGITEPNPSLRSFMATVERREKVMYVSNMLNGETDNIFGPPIFYDGIDQVLNVRNFDNVGTQPEVEVSLQGLTRQDHVVQVKLNGAIIGSMSLDSRENATQKFLVDRSSIVEGSNVVTLTSMNGEADISLINWVRLTYPHFYRATNNVLRFTAPAGQTVRLDNFTSSNLRVVDITDANAPTQPTATVKSAGDTYSVTVAVTGNGTRTLLAFADDTGGHPAALTANQPSNWSDSTNGADMLIVTYKDFRSAIEPLANLRRQQGMVVSIVDVEDIYDEFSYGAHTPYALKSLLSLAKGTWQRKPKYVLLAGDSTWDPRNYLDHGDNDFVPTKLIDTNLMETSSDDWFADFNNSGVAEIAIGRLPGRTAAEISLMVSKILTYEQERTNNTPLREAVLVSDNGFERQTSDTRALLPASIPTSTLSRSIIANDDLMRAQIMNALNNGPMLVNYYGHGSIGVWTGSALLDNTLASTLSNTEKPSIYVMMTCLNGYASDASLDSLAEASLKAPNGGAVAVWASSGFTEPPPQFALSSEFYRLLFTGTPLRLGDATRTAKAASPNIDVRRTWILFGDPAMRVR